MQTISDSISFQTLKELAKDRFGNLVKAVVDIDKGTMAIDAGLHADLEADLLSSGSKQEDLWGINLYPDKSSDEMVEFDSMINVRPNQNNFSRGVEDGNIRRQILELVGKLVK